MTLILPLAGLITSAAVLAWLFWPRAPEPDYLTEMARRTARPPELGERPELPRELRKGR